MKNFYLCVLFLIASSSSMAEDKRITIAFGDAIPPWVLENGDGGILIDLVKDVSNPQVISLTLSCCLMQGACLITVTIGLTVCLISIKK